MNGMDRAMPSVNQKKGSASPFLGILAVVVISLGAAVGVAMYAVNKLKNNEPQDKQQAQEEPVPIKARKVGDVNAMPLGVTPTEYPDPMPDRQVPGIGVASAQQQPGQAIPLRQPGSGPKLGTAPGQNTVPEISSIPPRQGEPQPSPYDSGFNVTGGGSKGGSSPIPGLPSIAGLTPTSAQMGPGSNMITPPGGYEGGSNASSNRGALSGNLNSTNTPTVKAGRISNRSLMVSEGTTAECVLRTRIIVQQSGMVVCRLTTPIYSSNGKVVMADRGSQVTGEVNGTLKQGQTRVFVLWRRIETPEGVKINIDAPAADPLGSAGVDGDLDNRWPERIGAALMLSWISDAIAYQTAKDASGGTTGTIAYQNSAQTGKSIAEKVLESTINIPPILSKNQGETLLIMIPRDLDFSSVYDLHAK